MENFVTEALLLVIMFERNSVICSDKCPKNTVIKCLFIVAIQTLSKEQCDFFITKKTEKTRPKILSIGECGSISVCLLN